ncbi:MAG: hypothetical protein CL609_18180 [Anaerolineaceae bacterium]|nr:hypothetical protein [Anaerolineaceae bacterium]
MGMSSTVKRRVWIGVIVFVVMFIAVSFIFARQWLIHLPSVQQQIREKNGAVVMVTQPENHSSWPLDAVIPIQVDFQTEDSVQSLELYVDGNLVNQHNLTEGSAPEVIFWQPSRTGSTVLTARLITTAGLAYQSEAVTVFINDPAGAIVWLETAGGETLPELSQRFQAQPEIIQQENPDVNFNEPLSSGLLLKIKQQNLLNMAAVQLEPVDNPSQNPDLILPDLYLDSQPETVWSRVKVSLDNLSPVPKTQPNPPELSGFAVDCEAQLTFRDFSEMEDGFFVYRILPGSSDVKKIATLPADQSHHNLAYRDAPQALSAIYTVAAYNVLGESSSKPVEINFAPECSANQPVPASTGAFDYAVMVVDGDLKVEDHTVHFQQPVDLAYLYISVNQQDWERIPAGNQKFLSGAGDKFDLDIYLDQIINKNPATKLEVDMEIWGWSGKKLIDYGTIHVSVRRTVLRVCGLAGADCDDLLRTEINLPPASDPATLTYFFEWDTADRTETIDYVWQVAAKPFTGEEIRSTQSLIISRGVYNTKDPRFKFNLSYLYKDGPYDLGSWPYMGQSFDSNFFDDVYPPDTPFTLYVRVLPFDKDNNKLPTSNTVVLHYQTEWSDPLNPTYASNLPSRYQLEFLPETYRAPILVQESEWGCIVYDQNVYFTHPLFMAGAGIKEEDIKADPQNCNSPASPTCNGKQKPLQYTSGTKVCPNNYSEPSGFWNDVKTIITGVWDGVTGGWDYLAENLENAKNYLAEQIASVIPGCGAECTGYIKTGLEVGFTAVTGIPPTMPSYEEMVDEGIAYAVDMAAQEIGPMCDELCKEAIAAGLKEVIDYSRSTQPAPGCADEGQAHARGKEPFCPNLNGVTWHPSPGSIYEPAFIQLKISRPPAPGNIPQMAIPLETQKKYRVVIYSYGYNDSRVGDWFPICGFHEGLDGDNAIGYNDAGGGYHHKRQINVPLESALYLPKHLTLPSLSGGEGMEIPLVFDIQEYWRANHIYDVNQFGVNFEDFYQNCGNDWPYLYYDGITRLTAVEECLNDQNQWVPCSGGGMDVFETTNPAAP